MFLGWLWHVFGMIMACFWDDYGIIFEYVLPNTRQVAIRVRGARSWCRWCCSCRRCCWCCWCCRCCCCCWCVGPFSVLELFPLALLISVKGSTTLLGDPQNKCRSSSDVAPTPCWRERGRPTLLLSHTESSILIDFGCISASVLVQLSIFFMNDKKHEIVHNFSYWEDYVFPKLTIFAPRIYESFMFFEPLGDFIFSHILKFGSKKWFSDAPRNPIEP